MHANEARCFYSRLFAFIRGEIRGERMAAAIVLIAAGALMAYILIGYPLLLALARGRAAAPIRKDDGYRTSVSVILAVHNGAAFIGQKIESILALDYPRELMEILIVSDGSTDDTEAIVERFAARGVRMIKQPQAGKAAALNRALQLVSGEILFFTDVRQCLDPAALSHLVANFADPAVGAVTGEMRLLRPDAGEQADMDLYWRYELWARRRHSEVDSVFNTTGCIYAMRRELAGPIRPDTLSDDAMLPLEAFFRGYRVVFDPAALAFDYPALPGSEFRRRWRNLAGLWQVHVWMRKLFTSANRMRFHFLSHKFGRLVLPWAILAIVGATFALPKSSWRAFLLWDEAAFLALAVLDRLVPKQSPIKRISSPARTFLLMNAAALAAAAVFFVPPQRLWKPTRVR
jgi:cellulose synthase/poly-beta-1,6-N-acetylglucosamine synthase-like glycosyltransferase